MKSSLLALTALLLSVSLHAQCFGIYPPGVSPVPLSVTLCNNITSGNTPFMVPTAPLDITVGGPLRFSWSGLPDYPVGPGFFECYTAIGLAPLSSGVPVTVGTNCLAYVLPDIALHLDLITLPSNCISTTYAIVPAIPALAGIPLIFQGFVRDPLQNKWATSNLSTFTL